MHGRHSPDTSVVVLPYNLLLYILFHSLYLFLHNFSECINQFLYNERLTFDLIELI